MPFSVSALYRKYADHHFWMTRPGFALHGADGAVVGYIDQIHYGAQSVQVDGWTRASDVSLSEAGCWNWHAPEIARPDVLDAYSSEMPLNCGFSIAAQTPATGALFSARDAETLVVARIPELPTHIKKLAHIRLAIRFVSDCAVGLPALLRCLMRPTIQARQAAKRALRMGERSSKKMLDMSFFGRAKPMAHDARVTIIVPVFNARELTAECLRRVVEHTDLPWRLVIIEDKSTDPSLLPWLTEWCAAQSAAGRDVKLVCNSENQGFIRSVNRALRIAVKTGEHAVLLNTDAFVPDKWASRLLRPIASDPSIASVTPLSNNAEVLTVPAMCQPHELAWGKIDKIDTIAARSMRHDKWVPTPTGVGFCMALNAKFLQQLPELDTSFGAGYGEEVDWCQKAVELGGRHVCQPALFVEHAGGASFGSERKRRLIAENNAKISRRYPNFDRTVQQFMLDDPLASARMGQAIAQTSALQDRVQVFVAHSLGGGAELYLQQKLKDLRDQGAAALVLRVGGPCLWKLEHHNIQGVLDVSSQSKTDILEMLKIAENFDIIYSCAVGHPEPLDIPELLSKLALIGANTLRILIHDYFCLSEAYTLLTKDNVFSGISPNGLEDEAWRLHWHGALEAAQDIICFSIASQKLVRAAYPDFAQKIAVRPHRIVPTRLARTQDMGGAIGVLGDIGLQKGAEIVSALTRLASDREVAVVGTLDPAFSLGPIGTQTGPYDRTHIATLAEDHNLSCWLIPSIWPETFSYTTHEALATGLPVFTFDLGGQAEAAHSRPNGYVMPLAWAKNPQKIKLHIDGVLMNGGQSRSVYSNAKRRRNRGFAA